MTLRNKISRIIEEHTRRGGWSCENAADEILTELERRKDET